jgi:hypothetical protein
MSKILCQLCQIEFDAAVPPGGRVRCPECKAVIQAAEPQPGAEAAPAEAPPPKPKPVPPPAPRPAPPPPPPRAKAPAKAREPAPRPAPAPAPVPAAPAAPANPFAFDAPANAFDFSEKPSPSAGGEEAERPRLSRRKADFALQPAIWWSILGTVVFLPLALLAFYNYGNVNHKFSVLQKLTGSDYFGDEGLLFLVGSEHYPAFYGLPIPVLGLLPWVLAAGAVGMMMRRPWGRSLTLFTSALATLFFLGYSLVLLFVFLPTYGFGERVREVPELAWQVRLGLILTAVWYLIPVPCFLLLFIFAFKRGSREAIAFAEEDRDRKAERKKRVRLPLRGAILTVGIFMLLRCFALGAGAVLLLLGYVLATPADKVLLEGMSERMRGYLVVMLGSAGLELLLAFVGFVLSIGLIARLKLARWPALLWGFAAVVVALVPLGFLFYSIPPGYDQWWCSSGLFEPRAGGVLTARFTDQVSWFSRGFVVSFALFVGLLWALLNPRFSRSFPPKPKKEEPEDEGEDEPRPKKKRRRRDEDDEES